MSWNLGSVFVSPGARLIFRGTVWRTFPYLGVLEYYGEAACIFECVSDGDYHYFGLYRYSLGQIKRSQTIVIPAVFGQAFPYFGVLEYYGEPARILECVSDGDYHNLGLCRCILRQIEHSETIGIPAVCGQAEQKETW